MTGAEILVVLGASLLGAFVKSVTGMGYPVLAVPLIALVLGVEDAVVIVAAPNLAANTLLCLHARTGRGEARDLPRILTFGVLGAAVGTFVLVRFPDEPLVIALVVTIALFLYNAIRAPDLHVPPAVAHRWSPAVGGVAGVMQGAVGVSGPIVAAWIHSYRLSREAYVFSVTAIFGLTGGAQLLLLVAAGEFTAERTLVAVLAFIPVLAMIPLGTRLRGRLDGRGFELAVLGVIATSGAALLLKLVA